MQDNILVFPEPPPGDRAHLVTHALPRPLTPLIGREQAVKATQTLSSRPEVRLLTLTGTPGVGKTRLGLQVATELSDTFADGVSFVSLAPLSDPDLVLPTLTQALGLPEARGSSPLEHLQACLHDKHLLLLLDNFEQVASAAVLLVALLQTCPGLKAMVTSRALLHVRGEYEIQVSPLDLPDPNQFADVELLRRNAAVTLFTQRAQALAPDFALTGTNAPVIAAICARLDGLPLAIELAAARIKLLSPEPLLSRLEHRLDVLTSGAQDLPVRQQTLRATLQWSYELLSPGEQRLFRLLSVFVGGCMLEAVEAVCHALLDGATAVLDGVQRLLDNNLLFERKQSHGEARLMMLAPVRAKALYNAGAMAYYGGNHSRAAELNGEGLKLYRELGDKQGIAISLNALGHIALTKGDYTALRALYEESLPLLEVVGDTWHLAEALYLSAYGCYAQGDYVRARALGGESLALCRGLGDLWGMAVILHALGLFAFTQGDYATARTCYEESLTISRTMGEKWVAALCLVGLGEVVAVEGKPARAACLWGAAETLRAELGAFIPHAEHVSYERSMSTVRAQLSEDVFSSAWAEGRTMSLEQVLAAQGTAEILALIPTEPLSAPPMRMPPTSPAGLTTREMDVLRLLAQGLTSSQIAERLVIGVVTVNFHVRSIYSKLGVSFRSAAARYALEHHLV